MCWGEALEIGSDQAVGAACQWYLDGAALQGQTGNVFEYRPLLEDLGVHRLEVKVADAPLEKSLSWEVYVSLSNVECMYGLGYPWSVEGYDHLVATREELEQALENAADEDVIYVEDGAEIDLTGENPIVIPAGVTLAGGRGRDPYNSGPLLFRDDCAPDRPLMIAYGRDIRITGLRLRGPGAFYDGGVATGSRGITAYNGIEIDNCEIYEWSYAAINIQLAHNLQQYIHHNHIHDCWGPLGYGVMMGVAYPLIEANVFENCRHAIAGVGQCGCSYEACYNVVLSGRPEAHCFDMHSDYEDIDPLHVFPSFYRAGSEILIHHNVFTWVDSPAVVIRGKPRVRAEIYHNWFFHDSIAAAVHQTYNTGNMSIYDNLIGMDSAGGDLMGIVPD